VRNESKFEKLEIFCQKKSMLKVGPKKDVVAEEIINII
jgi:hypothetical protein